MELIAVLFSLISVILTIRVNIWCWLTGMIGILAYFILFVNEHLYAQAILQTIFICQSIYGWFYWGINNEKKPSFTITSLRFCIHMAIVFVVGLGVAFIFDNYTDDPAPITDAYTTVLSLLAMWYMTKKCVWSWLVWVIADILFVFMFMKQEMYWSAGLYFIFMVLAIKGLIEWTKNTTTD